MSRSWQLLALLAAAALLYAAFPSRTLECDAVIYASGALRGVRALTFYPAHLGFGPIEVAAARVARAARPPFSPIDILRYVSLAAALIGLFFFDRTLREHGVTAARAALFAAVLAVSYGFWHFALQAESHILSTAFLLIFLWWFCRVLEAPSPGGAARAGVLLALATLMHQRNLVLLAPALLGLAMAVRERRRLPAVAGAFLAAYTCLAIVPYLVVARAAFGFGSLPEIRQWILGLATTGQFGYWTRSSLLVAGVGVVRSFAGSHYLLGVAPIGAFASRLFARASLEDEWAVAHAVAPALRPLLLALELALGVLAAAALARTARHLPALGARRPAVVAFLLAWIATIGLFTAWWAPVRAEFWIDFFPPLLVLVALAPARAGSSRLLAGFTVALAAVNLLGSLRPQSLATTDPETSVAVALDATVTPGDAVAADIPFWGRASRYALAFGRVDVLGAAPLAALDSALAAADSAHRRVYLLATPLGTDPAARASYRALLPALAARYRLGPPVPIRSSIDLRQLTRR